MLNSISSYKTNTQDNIINNDNQNIYYYFLFNKTGICIFEKKIGNNSIFINEEQYNDFKILIKKISVFLLINNQNSELFLFNRFLFGKYKLVILLKSKLSLIGLFSINSSKSFQNLLLIHLYMTLLNFKGDSISKLNIIGKFNIKTENNLDDKCYTFQQFIQDNQEKIKNSEIKSLSTVDILELSIYDKYFVRYCIIHFEQVLKELTKREEIDLTYTKFENLYLIDISSEQILFDLCEFQNIQTIKYYKNENLFKEILFHSHQLYDGYTNKYSMRFTKIDSSQRFVKFECTSTYPRLLFIIKFIPVLKGIIIVHIYQQKKLSRITNNNLSINPENRYKEIDLVFGSFLNENGGMDLKYVMPKKLVNIEKFCEEFFLTNRNCNMFKLYDLQKQFKYFNYSIIDLINSMPIDIYEFNQQKIFEILNEKIKNKYLEEKSENKDKKKKILIKKSSGNFIPKDENLDGNNQKSKANESIDKLFLIDKNLLYNDLFKFTIDKNTATIQKSEINNNYSTIKSNQNIIKILRESEKNISNNCIKKKKNNQTKDDKSIPSEINTITLMSESNLISKEDDYSNSIMLDNFSLISNIKKNDSNNFKGISKYYKKNLITLKKLKFHDLLNNSSSKNPYSGLENIKEKSKIIEECESDRINRQNTSNMPIKKEEEKKGKIRNKLKLFNND